MDTVMQLELSEYDKVMFKRILETEITEGTDAQMEDWAVDMLDRLDPGRNDEPEQN